MSADDNTPTGAPSRAPGTTITERIEHWRTLSWAQLQELMRPAAAKNGPVPADRLEAPPVQVIAQEPPEACR